MFSQLLLIVSILLLALTDPARSPLFVALGALLVAATSSTQDIVVDAFRVESLPESEQAAGMASYVAAYRIGMLVSTAGALFIVSGFESTGIRAARGLDVGLCRDGRDGADRHRHRARRHRARAIGARRSRDRRGNRVRRVLHAAIGAFSEFLGRKDAWAALVFVVLFKFTDAFSGIMTAPFVIDLGFTRNDYATIVKGVGLAATPDRRLCRRLRRAALFAGGEPVDRRRVAGARQSLILLAGAGRRQSLGAGIRDHGGKFHQRHRHRDLRRLSVGAVQKSAAYRHPIRAADSTCRGGAHLFVLGRGLCARRPAGRCSLRSACWSRSRA